ncbi:hypothetical protein Q428_12590 [Fervidicella metallireducens AeB]|uniref:Uncharacterized protein n=1 Tax=Fervidicella metallireducens AeB TaxID=1403537 RepID=A0A017RS66_9CLOT|nr:hypothetical protein [Fervidicella metallireducens]EYE87573.1 hypothetical protein Q428_12590 [Fervidicella metallireducens AeB]
MKNIGKKGLYILLAFSLFLNLWQLDNIKRMDYTQKYIDATFINELRELDNSIKDSYITNEGGYRIILSAVGQCRGVVRHTSYSKKNKELVGTIIELETFLMEYKFNKKSEKKLYELKTYISKLKENPNDIDITKNLYNYILTHK